MSRFRSVLPPARSIRVFLGIILSPLAVLTGCSRNEIAELTEQVGRWECPVPPGGEQIRPLWNLASDDTTRIKEVRERVELIRRQRKDSWDSSMSQFAMAQMHFGGDFYYPAEYKDRALLGLRQAKDGVPLFKGHPQQFVDGYKEQYDRDCGLRNQGIMAMLAEKSALAALRTEAYQPWLNEKNRVACRIASVPHCK